MAVQCLQDSLALLLNRVLTQPGEEDATAEDPLLELLDAFRLCSICCQVPREQLNDGGCSVGCLELAN